MSLEEIYLFSLPINDSEIIELFLGMFLKDEGLKFMPSQKQTQGTQGSRFKAFVTTENNSGHVGFAIKCSEEVATAVLGSIILAKLSTVPVQRGYGAGARLAVPVLSHTR